MRAPSVELTPAEVIKIIQGAVLLPHYGDCLSAHEQDMIVEIAQRYRRDGRSTFITSNEWPVFETAVEAMDGHRNRLDRRAGEAA